MKFDYVFAGGGLQSGLMALAVLRRGDRPTVAVVERGRSLGGNHLWSFHAGDVSDDNRWLVDALIEYRWSGYAVLFPHLTRSFDEAYASVTSARLDRVVRAAIDASVGSAIRFGREALAVSAQSVVLDDGEILEGKVVVDARGPDAMSTVGRVAFQKFVGLELVLDRPHRKTRPLLIDASVEQLDGFRFVYTLPLDDRRLLVEDTYFSRNPDLDVANLRGRVLDYVTRRGLTVSEIARVETGVLPLPLDTMPSSSTAGVFRAGYGGGWFHPTTGYSLPAAVRLAVHLARTDGADLYGPAYRALVAGHQRQARFALLLNRLLFLATPSEEMWRVLERFHRLPDATIRRFYAMTSTAADRVRILCGRPPRGVSLLAALSSLRGRSSSVESSSGKKLAENDTLTVTT